ncbi:MAG: 30S ribosome-binding factor RbfA [Elusimicrobiota bacterium]
MYDRGDRLKELFREELVLALRGVKDPGVAGLMTVTDVTLSQDRKLLKAYYSVMGDEGQRRSTAKALERCCPYLRMVLRERVQIKVIPQIVFEFDDTPKRASRIDKLLGQIEEEGHEKPS